MNPTKFRGAIAFLIWFLSLASAKADTPFIDPVFDFKALTSTPLNPRVLSSTEKDGIVTEEVRFHSETDGPKDVDIYGLFSYPKGAKKLPAFVWNQAGLGQASTYFTELGARRGYAALCIDMPLPKYRSTGEYNISMDFPADVPPKENPIYHGAVALLKAVSYLESRPEVDAAKIGMAGSSWGGFYTTLMAGIDPRIKAASAMFGSGGLELGNVWWDGVGTAARDAKFREKWSQTLDPAYRLPYSKTAIAWFTGTNDHFFWMPGVMRSYERAAGPKHLTLVPNWNHGLPPKQDDQVFEWLDIHLKGKPTFSQISKIQFINRGIPSQRRSIVPRVIAQWTVSGRRQVKEATLLVSPGAAGNWENRPWRVVPAYLERGVFSADLPTSGVPIYISACILDESGFISSTPIQLVPAQFMALNLAHTELGPRASRPLFQFDGASTWGQFETGGIAFLKGLAFANPAVSADAYQGTQSIELSAGRNDLRPLYYLAGEKHRLVFYAKSRTLTKIGVEFKGTFDGLPQIETKDFEVGTVWTKIEFDYAPHPSRMGNLSLCFTVPDSVKINLDSLTFTPARD